MCFFGCSSPESRPLVLLNFDYDRLISFIIYTDLYQIISSFSKRSRHVSSCLVQNPPEELISSWLSEGLVQLWTPRLREVGEAPEAPIKPLDEDATESFFDVASATQLYVSPGGMRNLCETWLKIWAYWVTELRMTPTLRGSIRHLIVRAVPCCAFNHEPPHSLWFPSMMKIPALPFARGWRLDPIPRDLQRVFGSVMYVVSKVPISLISL